MFRIQRKWGVEVMNVKDIKELRAVMQKIMDRMYEDNKICEDDMIDIFQFDIRIYQKAYLANPCDFEDFDDFKIYQILRDGSFCDNDKDELDMNEWALEVMDGLFNMTPI